MNQNSSADHFPHAKSTRLPDLSTDGSSTAHACEQTAQQSTKKPLAPSKAHEGENLVANVKEEELKPTNGLRLAMSRDPRNRYPGYPRKGWSVRELAEKPEYLPVQFLIVQASQERAISLEQLKNANAYASYVPGA
ncbi:hypothetical protein CRD19_07445 [Corynebacterium sp. LK32]|nr:hypothetical protein CEQ06_01345 [Corynebacterium jeikeium]MBC6768608.1 hypothetical protein [Corynebacterium sp. LK15]MBC6796571.1 hypothetical protein [Corynebacterium sp. LK31]MBC6830261.1 hypothetical protein [Corynebacterium sp. LK32]MBC6831969.1 hypothetical protein [Corynebacterium sp. LK29]PLA36542.1 hypothetical protein CYJ42_01985 [Corynebacterium amycolatum]TXS68768.1 hypothetical protein CHU68_10280 [Corynebacterium sp. LK11]